MPQEKHSDRRAKVKQLSSRLSVTLVNESRPLREWRSTMKYNAPTQVTFIIALVLAIVAVLSRFVSIQNVTVNAFWILLIAYVVLAIGCVFRRR